MLVSILIPCYNAERWVGQAIESALSQTWREKEVIVVDDGSRDGSLQEIQKFDGRVLWQTGPNRGGNATRNKLLELARGEWLQYLDADDYLLPDKVANHVEFLSLHPQTDVIFGPVTLEYTTKNGTRREISPVPEPHDPWILLARWYLRQTGGPLWRKQAIVDVGGWKPDQPCCQEHELYLRLLMAGKRFSYCPESGTIYRQLGKDSVSTRDIPQVHRHRLEIIQRTEDFLRTRKQMTRDRLWSINQARFEIARMVWLYEPDMGLEIVGAIRRSQPDFVPGDPAARLHYRLVYRMLGFRFVETLANWKRTLLSA
jgi:glycosyltransferase involved in cell wall biosynthesis